LYIGFTVTLCALAGGALTGASLNPARSFAPALISNIWTYHWVYWLGPIVGAIVAAFTARFLWQHKDIS
jgi:glycerol uptake facilitator-like aquaporin